MGKGRFKPEKYLKAAAREAAEEAYRMMESKGSINRDEIRKTMMRSFVRKVLCAKDTNSPQMWPKDENGVILELESHGAEVARKEFMFMNRMYPGTCIAIWDAGDIQISIFPDRDGKGSIFEYNILHPGSNRLNMKVNMSLRTLARIMKNIHRWADGFDEVLIKMEDGVRKRFMETRMIRTTLNAILAGTPHHLYWDRGGVRICLPMKDGRMFRVFIRDADIPEIAPRVLQALENLEKVRESLGVPFEVTSSNNHG